MSILNAALCTNGAYQDFFKAKMKDYGVSSPSDLSEEQKSKFFDEVDTEWKAKVEKNSFNMYGTCPKCGCALNECECENK